MHLHLIRHGETNWNREGRVQGQKGVSQLTEEGIRQCRRLRKRILDHPFDQIFCSTSRRTRQTAGHLFRDRLDGIEYLDALLEINLGHWEGELYEVIAKQEPESHRHFWHEPHCFRVAGAETFEQLQKRAMTVVDAIARDFQGRQVAVISHGALIKTVLCHIRQQPLSALWTPPHVHHCAHSIIEFTGNGERRILQYMDGPPPKQDQARRE